MLGEDRLLENVQAASYFAAAWIAIRTSRRLAAAGLRDHASASLGLALVSALLFLEEVSFGQRLLGLAPPEWIRRHNSQSELNLHNLSFWRGVQGEAQIAVCLVGALGWKILPRRWLEARGGLLARALPGPTTALYFAQLGLFLVGLRLQGWLPEARPLRSGHQELFETPFALGFALHAWWSARSYARALARAPGPISPRP